MAQKSDLAKAFITISRDERIKVTHISIYMALLYLWVQNGNANQIVITRKKVMQLAHISSIATYHKGIKQLQDFGYINYIPSYNHFSGSQVVLLFDS